MAERPTRQKSPEEFLAQNPQTTEAQRKEQIRPPPQEISRLAAIRPVVREAAAPVERPREEMSQSERLARAVVNPVADAFLRNKEVAETMRREDYQLYRFFKTEGVA